MTMEDLSFFDANERSKLENDVATILIEICSTEKRSVLWCLFKAMLTLYLAKSVQIDHSR